MFSVCVLVWQERGSAGQRKTSRNLERAHHTAAASYRCRLGPTHSSRPIGTQKKNEKQQHTTLTTSATVPVNSLYFTWDSYCEVRVLTTMEDFPE